MITKTKPSPRTLTFKGIVYGNIFAFTAFAIAYAISEWNDDVGAMLSFAEFVLVPIGMGIIGTRYWLQISPKLVAMFPYTLTNTFIGILLSAVFMGEGYICLLIVSPLILAFMWVGVLIGKYLVWKDNKTIRTSTLSVLLLLFVWDTFTDHNYVNVVTDELIVNAPPAAVWRYVAEHPENDSKPDYWLFGIGLPCPVQSTVTADTVGAERKCIFSNGATFDETVVEVIPEKRYTFDIYRQPADPEIIGHIEIRRGQFILEENADGTTRLIGKSWYRLMVYPAWYYDVWAEDITREVHLRVMRHIKTLAERDVQVGS